MTVIETDPPPLFNPFARRAHRDRAAAGFHRAAFLKQQVAEDLAERLSAIRRPFTRVLEVGSGFGIQGSEPTEFWPLNPDLWISADPSPAMLSHASGMRVAMEEDQLPFAPHSFDLVLGMLIGHHTHDLPGMLAQMRRVLVPDGLLLLSFFGGETLHELRSAALMLAEAGYDMRPLTAPMVDIRDGGALLQRAGFALPVADSYRLTVTYPDLWTLARDLRQMGETNCLTRRFNGLTGKTYWQALDTAYRSRFGDAEGRIPATFDILTLTGWAPAAHQPQPLKRGSATHSLQTVLGGGE
jgi:NADH dehydrogenase [ubiquinone] 1 alpha subcomplex assembly factor 5